MQYTAGMPERECKEQEKEDLAKRTKERGESGTGKTAATFAEPLKLLLFTVFILFIFKKYRRERFRDSQLYTMHYTGNALQSVPPYNTTLKSVK